LTSIGSAKFCVSGNRLAGFALLEALRSLTNTAFVVTDTTLFSAAFLRVRVSVLLETV
jgi:hypothetical protein